MDKIKEIFKKITEHHSSPVRGGRDWEANIYYIIENLDKEDIHFCADYLAERIVNVCSPNYPEFLINLKGSSIDLANIVADKFFELTNFKPTVIEYSKTIKTNNKTSFLKNSSAILINDVITTARTCLEAHSNITVQGASVLCWAALVDRTFGPGPVPVVAAFTGEPVLLLGKAF